MCIHAYIHVYVCMYKCVYTHIRSRATGRSSQDTDGSFFFAAHLPALAPLLSYFLVAFQVFFLFQEADCCRWLEVSSFSIFHQMSLIRYPSFWISSSRSYLFFFPLPLLLSCLLVLFLLPLCSGEVSNLFFFFSGRGEREPRQETVAPLELKALIIVGATISSSIRPFIHPSDTQRCSLSDRVSLFTVLPW